MAAIPTGGISIVALVIAGLGLVACAAPPRPPVDENDTFPGEAWQPAASLEESGWSLVGMAALEKRVAGIGSAAFMVFDDSSRRLVAVAGAA